MPLTPCSTTWGLLVVICVCLMVGNADVNAERETKQPGLEFEDEDRSSHTDHPNTAFQDEDSLNHTEDHPNTAFQDEDSSNHTEDHPKTAFQDGKLPIVIDKPPAVRPLDPKLWQLLHNKSKNTFPSVTKGGDLYYDLAGVRDEEVTVLENKESVKGITASHGRCRVRSLCLRESYLLDEDLFAHCPLLNLTMEGDQWQCVKVRRTLQHRNVSVNMELAECGDVWHDNKNNTEEYAERYKMEEGIQKLEEFGITECSVEKCMCKWYFEGGNYAVQVYCDEVGLTDDTLPTLPSKVRAVWLDRNSLRSMDKVIQHLIPYNQALENIFLRDNQMQDLPRLPAGTFPLLKEISVHRNRLVKIDIDAFAELVARKDFIIALKGNPFRCDCHMYSFKKFVHQYCLDASEWCRSYMGLKCKYEHGNKSVPLHEVSGDGCEGWDLSQVNWWIMLNFTLCVANVFMVYLMVDLICIHTNIGGKKDRRPTMDRIVCALKSLLCLWPWRKRRGHGEQYEGGATGVSYITNYD